MSDSIHLEHGHLVEYLDGELSQREAEGVREHLNLCGACARELEQLSDVSACIREVVASGAGPAAPAQSARSDRDRLLARLSPQVASKADADARKVLRRFGWAMALAASFALALLLFPRHGGSTRGNTAGFPASKAQLTSLDVNGETFVALPYSDPDLPLNAPRIVEMQVPVASLTAAGIALDPVANGSPDRTVRANVLLGIDGQPLGLHVLTAE